VKRYGRINREAKADIVATVIRYTRYGLSQRSVCLRIGISVSFFHVMRQQLETEVEPTVKDPRKGFNAHAILPEEEKAVVEYAIAHPNYFHRELTWRIIDAEITYISATTTYRILKKYGLIGPNIQRKSYGWIHKYSNEAHAPDERWQTDLTYLQYGGRDVYQLSFIDVYSRYIVFSITLLNMESRTVSDAFENYIRNHKHELKQIPVVQSDNGSPYIGHEFKAVMREFEIEHAFCHPATPTENVIIERWHRTFKENLSEHGEPEDFEGFVFAIQETITYYNHERYHQSLGYVTPFEFYRGDPKKIFNERKNYCKKVRTERRLKHTTERIKTLSIKETI